MASNIKFEVEKQDEDLQVAMRQFPDKARDMMAYIGAIGSKTLYEQFLSGQSLTLRKYPFDKRGERYRTVRGTLIGRPGSLPRGVQIKAPVLNLFDRGRNLRDGRREPGKRVYSKLRGLAQSQLQSWIDRSAEKYFPGIKGEK